MLMNENEKDTINLIILSQIVEMPLLNHIYMVYKTPQSVYQTKQKLYHGKEVVNLRSIPNKITASN